MTPKERSAMQQALEALEALNPYPASKENQRFDAINAMREALAEQQTERTQDAKRNVVGLAEQAEQEKR